MCDSCGCGHTEEITFHKPGEVQQDYPMHEHEHEGFVHSHGHIHPQDYKHTHDHGHPEGELQHGHTREINLEIDIMQKNNLLAERNRGYFEARGIFALNLVSSPGSGKTSILERTIREAAKKIPIYVIEGDQQTVLDAERIDKAGAPVLQVNTGNGCHLDATMVNTAVKKLEIPDKAVLMIENVGNLVCPALFDLGEHRRVVIISVTEGEDKPLKYPNMFQSSQLCLINKSDLLPYVDFDLSRFKEYALRINPGLEFKELSAKTGEGFSEWLEWLEKERVC